MPACWLKKVFRGKGKHLKPQPARGVSRFSFSLPGKASCLDEFVINEDTGKGLEGCTRPSCKDITVLCGWAGHGADGLCQMSITYTTTVLRGRSFRRSPFRQGGQLCLDVVVHNADLSRQGTVSDYFLIFEKNMAMQRFSFLADNFVAAVHGGLRVLEQWHDR